MLKFNINIDPFTGLPNLFELLECAPFLTYGNPGSVIAINIEHLTHVNKNYGRKSGDQCIKMLADCIKSIAVIQKNNHLASVFRTGDDEFIVLLPKISKLEAESLAIDLRKHFRSSVLNQNILGISLRTVVFSFDEKGISSADLMKAVRVGLSRVEPLTLPVPLPEWANQLIDNMVDRICETLNLLRQTQFLALNDEISGLPNHRAANLFIYEMLQMYKTSKRPYSILFIDGDNLKQYNNLNYQQGNQMIRELAKIISGSLRQDDLVARWLSGDEFIVVLPNTGQKLAFQIGERLRSAVETAGKNWQFPITISIGVSSCPGDGTNVETLIAKAEAANSRAKTSGKNQVV